MILDFTTQPDFSILDARIDWQKEIIEFWKEWKNEKDYIIVNTSGSTGKPKPISLPKSAVRASAQATCIFFDLIQNKTALLCLPAQYIAGKMMLIRAEWAQLKLRLEEPSLKVTIENNIDFCAMTPAQSEASLVELHKVKTLLLGGGPVSEKLRQKLQKLPLQCFESYGMTETISHIALKNLKRDTTFQPLPHVKLNLQANNCLEISAPHLFHKTVKTNDIAEIEKDGSFRILGRADNVINSGGIKISPEPLEAILQEKLGMNTLFFGEKDEQFGESLALIVEGKNQLNTIDFQKLGWEKYQMPKKIYWVESISKTPTGKKDRKETIKKLKK